MLHVIMRPALPVLIFLATCLPHSSWAQEKSACDDLFRQKIENVNLLSSALVPAQGDMPAYCRVLGVVRPAINFEVRFPASNWNGKFYMAGCGGFCGILDSDRPGFVNAMNFGLRRNYAVSTMDSGHWGTGATDGRWAFNNRVAEIDWGWRAVTETARVTKLLIKAFYGREQNKSYFAGCSTGGRMAAMEAQRFPNDFDGIISGAPALDYTGLVATSIAWITKSNTDQSGKAILNRAKVKLIRDAVQKTCGNVDGLVEDPSSCSFTPKQLQCKAGDAPGCLTADEVGVLEKWYSDARNSKGEVLYPGAIPKGSEPFWPLWLTGDEKGSSPLIPLFGRDFVRYMAFPDDPGENYGILQFDFDKDPERMRPMSEIYNAMNPDMSKFRDRGGKLIMYHGLSDPIVPPGISTTYWKSVTEKMGGAEAVSNFYRLFMIPGFDHCGLQQGPGISQSGLDPLTALENWVEKGIAPDMLPTTKYAADGKAERVRPLCPYPQVARLKGGDANDSANYSCGAP
jgi:feruloyl esterase